MKNKWIIIVCIVIVGLICFRGFQQDSEAQLPDESVVLPPQYDEQVLRQLQKEFLSSLDNYDNENPLEVCWPVDNSQMQDYEWPYIPICEERYGLFSKEIAFSNVYWDKDICKYVLPVCNLSSEKEVWLLDNLFTDEMFKMEQFQFVNIEDNYYGRRLPEGFVPLWNKIKEYDKNFPNSVELYWNRITLLTNQKNIEKQIAIGIEPKENGECSIHIQNYLSSEGLQWFRELLEEQDLPTWLEYSAGGIIVPMSMWDVNDLIPSKISEEETDSDRDNVSLSMNSPYYSLNDIEISWRMINNSDTVVYYSQEPVLEIYKEGSWYTVPWLYSNVPYGDTKELNYGLSLLPGSSPTFVLHLNYHAPLECGNYRIVQSFWTNDMEQGEETREVACFEIIDS